MPAIGMRTPRADRFQFLEGPGDVKSLRVPFGFFSFLLFLFFFFGGRGGECCVAR